MTARKPPAADFAEWLQQNGHPERHEIPLSRRAWLWEEWFRWRCQIGRPPDKNPGWGGHAPYRHQTIENAPPAPEPSGRRARSHRKTSGLAGEIVA